MATTNAKTGRSKAAAEKTFAATKSADKDAGDFAFSNAKLEMPEFVRSMAEQSLTQTRDAYARMKAAAEETTDVLEETLETTRESMREVQFKALDAAKASADATFDFYRQLLTATSVADAVELQTAFARARFEALVDYSKDMQATLNKVGAEASKPAKVAFERSLRFAQAA